MRKGLLLFSMLYFLQASAQQPVPVLPGANDSVTIAVHPAYDRPGKAHRFFFGPNYRREWAVPVTLPVIHLSRFAGGLKILQAGGGMQSKSIRLIDATGKEWIVRSVEKSPDSLLPAALRQTFARDWLDDVTSAQHPFSALAVPPLAEAVHVPHAHPVIGVIAEDSALGSYSKTFKGMVALVEEREPLGESANSTKMMEDLLKDNDNRIDGPAFLRARLLDMFVADWDRHMDQWRWFNQGTKKAKLYLGVPRDRDQVFHVRQGLFPELASRQYILPTLRDFDRNIKKVKWVLFKTRFVNALPSFQLEEGTWIATAGSMQKELTDSVLAASVSAMPGERKSEQEKLLETLKARRSRLVSAADEYFRFTQRIADLRLSNKNELVDLRDSAGGFMQLTILKESNSGLLKDTILRKTFDPELTREIRIYAGDGQDSIHVNAPASPIRLRVIGGDDRKHYVVAGAAHPVRFYDKPNGSSFEGKSIRKHISSDSANTAFDPVNLYNVWMPLISLGLNRDDGFLLGAGVKFTQQEGFRKEPYTARYQLSVKHSFSTEAVGIRFSAEWIHVFGKADLVFNADIRAPNNTVNFFGIGNETVYRHDEQPITYYRTRFSTMQFSPALRWRFSSRSSLSAGPALNLYSFDGDDNRGRLILKPGAVGSYDSLSFSSTRQHAGFIVDFLFDRRDNIILPRSGGFLHLRLQGWAGLNVAAANYGQLSGEWALYRKLTGSGNLVLAERLGGTAGIGKPAFYQQAVLGGQENLLGYRQYRFAGQHAAYSNLELRLKLLQLASYILPGELGLTGFWDIGRVWTKKDDSDRWHNGVGGGFYFAPASLLAFSVVAGYSGEGWYPYFTMGLRF